MGVMTLEVRPMAKDDLDEVAGLEREHQPNPWSMQTFRDELAHDNRIYLVAGSPVQAFGGVMIVGEEAHITNLLVALDRRRHGLGRLLMVSLLEAAIGDGAKHVTLEVRASNRAARALYGSLGLAPVGVRPKYYGNEDALILWAHDIDHPEFMDSLR